MAMTKVKKGKHYCPNCGAEAKTNIRIVEIDVTKRTAGSRFGYPYFGASIECVKCKWNGEWYIPKSDWIECNSLYQRLIQKKINHKQKPTKHKR